MKIPFVDLKAQYNSIKSEIDTAIQNVINETAFIKGKYVQKFEEDYADAYGVKNCISCANGTDAIYIALKALGVGPGDEVITVANSWISTSETITQAGAKPLFVDIHPDYYIIDVSKIEEKITAKTKAIIPVHLFGQPAEMKAILDICKRHNLLLIEDCAQAHFAEYLPRGIYFERKEIEDDSNIQPIPWGEPRGIIAEDNISEGESVGINSNDKKNNSVQEAIPQGTGQKVGTMGVAGTFSFFPGKNLGAYGDAGCIVSNNDDFAMKARMFANHGSLIKHKHEFEGINSRMDGIQAAILSVKLPYIYEWNQKRLQNALLYNEFLSDVKGVVTPKLRQNAKHIFHLYVIRAKKRDELQIYLKEHGISTGIHYPTALPFLKAYDYLEHKPEDFPLAYNYQSEILSLPMFPELTEEQISYVVEKIKEFIRNMR